MIFRLRRVQEKSVARFIRSTRSFAKQTSNALLLLHSLFEDFFMRYGPTRIDDDRFINETEQLDEQIILLICANYQDFIVFLTKEENT